MHAISFQTGCEIMLEAMQIAYGNEIEWPILNREGKTFIAWYKDINYNEVVNWVTMPDITPNLQANGIITLYAKWQTNTYIVNYNSGGAGGVMDSSEFIYGVEENLPLNMFELIGHDFKGWGTQANGTVVYQNGQTVKNLTNVNGGIITLYAIWEASSFEVVYENLLPGFYVEPTSYTYGIGLDELPIVYDVGGGSWIKVEPFYGWYTNANFTTRVYSISEEQLGRVILYAKYDYVISRTHSSVTETVTDGNINEQPRYSVDVLLGSVYFKDVKNTTLDTIVIKISFEMWEVNDGYQDIYLYNGSTQIWSDTINRGTGVNSSHMKYENEIILSISNYSNVDFMDLKFSAHGAFGDTWKFSNFNMTITFTN